MAYACMYKVGGSQACEGCSSILPGRQYGKAAIKEPMHMYQLPADHMPENSGSSSDESRHDIALMKFSPVVGVEPVPLPPHWLF